MSAEMLEVSLLGVGAVLRLERDACVVKSLRQATNEYPAVYRLRSFVRQQCVAFVRISLRLYYDDTWWVCGCGTASGLKLPPRRHEMNHFETRGTGI